MHSLTARRPYLWIALAICFPIHFSAAAECVLTTNKTSLSGHRMNGDFDFEYISKVEDDGSGRKTITAQIKNLDRNDSLECDWLKAQVQWAYADQFPGQCNGQV